MASKSKPKTRKEDAESVLGDPNLAEEVAKTALENKSDVLVEMSETDEPVVDEVPTTPTIETPVLVEDANTNKKEAMGDEEEDEEKDVKEKKDKTYKSLSDEDVLRIAETVKSIITPAQVDEPAPVTQKSPLDVSYENLYNVIESVKSASMSYEEKLQTIQPVLEELGGAIVEVVKSATPPAPTQVPSSELSQVLAELKSVSSKVEAVVTDVATIKAQQLTPTQLAEKDRIPVPRSIVKDPQNLVQKSQEVNPNSVRNISRRSVGLAPISE